MKNKKMIFGTIILLFVMIGIFNISNVSADVEDLPPLTYISYSKNLESKDKFWIEVDVLSDGAVNVYVMNEEQHNTLIDSGGLIWNYLIRWSDVIYLYDSFEITEDGMYYVVVYNKSPLSSRTVDIDITIRYYYPPVKDEDFFLGWLLFIILPVIAGVVIVVVVVKKRKGKIPREVIIQEKIIPIKVYCSKCGIEIVDKSRKFCSNCGTQIIN